MRKIIHSLFPLISSRTASAGGGIQDPRQPGATLHAGGCCRGLVRHRAALGYFLLSCPFLLFACGLLQTSYQITKGTVKAGYTVTKVVTLVSWQTGKTVYRVGEFTFKVVAAPLSWALTRDEIETIDGLPPKEAIRQGHVKRAPYVVRGKTYYPMTVEAAQAYRQTGIASWYGAETRQREGGHMTANGEAFQPEGLNAAHRLLPLPTYVRVTNLENRRQIVVRVNDRGPFVRGRLIDLSAGAARRLGFFRAGTAPVLVETVAVE